MKISPPLFLILCLLCQLYDTTHAYENLDEMINRKSRLPFAKWGVEFFEDPSHHYTWQPETLMYTDTTTGKEVWIVTRQPKGQDVYSKEHGTHAWSADGSRIGFFDFSTRTTQNPNITSDRGVMRWLVNSNGSGLRAAEGYGKYSLPLGGFGWANTEVAYYAFGSHALLDAPLDTLTKMTLDANNLATGTILLDTSSTNDYQKGIVKEGISTTDSSILYRDYTSHTKGTACESGQPSSGVYKTELDDTIQIDSYFLASRNITGGYDHDPSTAENRFHDIWGLGKNHERILGDYSGNSSIFIAMNSTGSCSDGGPQFTESNQRISEVKVVSNGGRAGESTPNIFGLPYFGHPTIDRWGRYLLLGTYTDNPKPGTRLIDTLDWKMLPDYVLAFGKYDGQHHTWGAWSDYLAAVDPTDLFIYQNKYTRNYTAAEPLVDTHHPGIMQDNYNGYPRPSQSPDGTKIAFASFWLNNSNDNFPYIAYAVANYPHPPEIISISQSNGSYTVRFDWRLSSSSPRGYTSRGWPDEDIDGPPPPREIQSFRLWRSSDLTSWNPVSSIPSEIFERYDFATGQWKGEVFWEIIDTPPNHDTTYYYAITSMEHSGLESRTLSNIFNSSGVEVGPYPTDPAGITTFWSTPPEPPDQESIHVTYQKTPGHINLSWTEPQNSHNLIRYYNIYYSPTHPPSPSPEYRIASVPVGTTSWLDWLALPDSQAYYRITSVDTQGNESIVTSHRFPLLFNIFNSATSNSD